MPTRLGRSLVRSFRILGVSSVGHEDRPATHIENGKRRIEAEESRVIAKLFHVPMDDFFK